MDEILFRSSEKMENLQIQSKLLLSKSKDLFLLYSHQSKALFIQAWNSTQVDQLRQNLKELLLHLISITQECKERLVDIIDPKRFYMFLSNIFGRHWTKRDITFACAGFLVGGIVGVVVGLSVRRRETVTRYMQAVQCSHYLGPESATVVEDAIAPYECGDHDVLINVKAASVQLIDVQICSGYGSGLRRILRRIHKQSSSDLPVILGRDCTGVITDLGSKVKRLEIGDEVWVTVPFWSQGTLCQTVLVSENRVSRKPKNVGFEGACSLPYPGSLALSALNKVQLECLNTSMKRVLVQDGCTPVGCVLIQLLKRWKVHVTASCHIRAIPVAKALGADEVIPENDETNTYNTLLKELELRNERFDAVFLTSRPEQDFGIFNTYCENGKIVTTLPPKLDSDSCSFLGAMLLAISVRLTYLLKGVLGVPLNSYDETHLCYATLDKLMEYVEDGYLQTVVEKVLHPQDIEVAFSHIQSPAAIGSTIITFR